MIEVGALLFGTAFFGGNLAGTVLGGVLGNAAYDGVQGFWRLRSKIFNPNLQDCDLQKVLLQALANGVQAVTARYLKHLDLSLAEQDEVQIWQKFVLKKLHQTTQDIECGRWQWHANTDMGMLLSASAEDLSNSGSDQITTDLKQLKEQYERLFLELDRLPQKAQPIIRQEWLAATSLYLAEAIKTQSRVSTIFQTNLLLDTQSRVQNLEGMLVNYFNNPQQFLEAVQPGAQIDIEGLRSTIADFTAEMQTVKENTVTNLQVSEQILAEVREQRRNLGDMKSFPTHYVSTIIDQSRPRTEHWQGRESEMQEIQAQLSQVSLIGITGLGGYGKSALANQIFEAADFANKIWVTVSQPYRFGDLGRWLLAQLGVQIDQKAEDEQVTTALVNLLSTARALIVLDNLETLLTETQDWHDPAYRKFWMKWLGRGRSSVILITSRERPDLPIDNSYWQPALRGLEPDKGVQLLREFRIQGTDLELTEFVNRVDGHPLLLNLAAGSLTEEFGDKPEIRHLSTIAPNLFEVGGLHQDDPENNVKKLFEASLARLEPELRQFLSNLSVYRLPFNHEAAAAQLPNNVMPEISEQDLRQLAQRSLLQELGQRDLRNKRQFTFQPLLLSYAQQSIDDRTTAHHRAISYYLKQFQPSETWQSEDDLTVNLEVVHHWCELKQFAAAYGNLSYCSKFLGLQGYHRRLIALLSRIVLEWEPSNHQEWIEFGNACTDVGIASRHLKNYKMSISFHQMHLFASRAIGDRHSEATALGNLGSTHQFIGEYDKAIELAQQALEIHREISDSQGEARSMGVLGNAYLLLKQYQSALDCHQQHLDISRKICDRYGEATALGNLANVYTELSDYSQAINLHKQALKIEREIGNKTGVGNTLKNLGGDYKLLGEQELAIEFFQQYLSLMLEIDETLIDTSILNDLAQFYGISKKYEYTINFYLKALEIDYKIGNKNGTAITLINLGCTLFLLGKYESATNALQDALTISREIGDKVREANSLCNLGKLSGFLQQGHKEFDYLQQALTISQEIGDKHGEASALSALGSAYDSLGEYKQSIDLMRESLKIQQAIGDKSGEAASSFNLGVTLAKLKRRTESISAYQNARVICEGMGWHANVKDCDAAIHRLSQPSNPFLTLLKRINRFLRRLWQSIW